MATSITTLVLGAIITVLGIVNMTGNISSLHRYHRHRVAPEDVKPFGRRVGLGTLICGVGVVAYGALMLVFEKTALDVLVLVGTGVMLASLAVGLAISLWAIKKYNKGII